MIDPLGQPTVFVVDTAEAMHQFGVELARVLSVGDVVILTGPLGAGKTTLTRGIGAGLGVRGPVTSPTFVLARTHPNEAWGPPLVHVDAYRLRDPAELDDLDLDFAGAVVVIEWGAGMIAGAVESWVEVELDRPTGAGVVDHQSIDGVERDAISEDNDEPRRVTITGYGPRWTRSGE